MAARSSGPKHRGRVVIVASGTGFAPMWSVATAAIKAAPQRELIFIVTSRTLQSFYMHAALCRLARFPRVSIIPIVSEPQTASTASAIRSGRPTEYMPELTPNDVVYTAGAPAMVEAIAKLAKAGGARCYTDPFSANHGGGEEVGLLTRLTGWLDGARNGGGGALLQPMQARLAHVGVVAARSFKLATRQRSRHVMTGAAVMWSAASEPVTITSSRWSQFRTPEQSTMISPAICGRWRLRTMLSGCRERTAA